MSNDKNILILENGVSFVQWRAALQAKLARRNVLGHVFHNIMGIRPAIMPLDPTITSPNAMNMDELITQHIERLEQWILKEIEAKSIVVSRLNPTNCPQAVENMTAKQLYDNIAGTRQETAAAPYITALESFLQVRFETTADKYIDSFLSTLQNVNNAADSFPSNDVMGCALYSKAGLHLSSSLV